MRLSAELLCQLVDQVRKAAFPNDLTHSTEDLNKTAQMDRELSFPAYLSLPDLEYRALACGLDFLLMALVVLRVSGMDQNSAAGSCCLDTVTGLL